MRPLRPTDEQQAILDAHGRVVLINARAGTGKTATLRLIAEAHRDQKIIYLAFNKQAQLDAEGTFPPAVETKTVHGFAFKHEAQVYNRRWQVSNQGISPADFLPAFQVDAVTQRRLAWLSHGLMNFYMNSPYQPLEKALPLFSCQCVEEKLQTVLASQAEAIVHACHTMAKTWHEGAKECPHDFYLKLFHASKRFHKALEAYDIILVDEAQDLSPVMLDVLQSCPKKLFVVGDTHQQIYTFRHAVDAMTKLDADQVLELSQSFRFGPQIAELAQTLIQEAKSIPGFIIRGNPAVASRASLYGRHEIHREVRSATLLARTNLGLFTTALDLHKKGIALRFDKDMTSVLGQILDVMHVARNAPEQARNAFVRSFPSLKDIDKYAEETQDFALAQTCKIVTQYERELPKVAFDLMKLCNDSRQQEREYVTLTTVHGAKGKEYPRVIIDTDLPLHLKRTLDNDVASQDEINLAYVAITRVQTELRLPEDLRRILGNKWRSTLSGLGRKPSRSERGRPRSTFRQKPQRPRRGPKAKRWSVGQIVKTTLGVGKIVKMGSNKCLVDLTNQSGNVWENYSNLQ